MAKLNQELQDKTDYAEKLKNEYEDCQKKLARARMLIDSLGGEKGRWG